MTTNEIKVASAMSNMIYRSIREIAEIAEMPPYQVSNIILSFRSRKLVEFRMQGITTYYRLK